VKIPIGSWVGAHLALSGFKQQRAFDKQLEWYEQANKSLQEMIEKIDIALTFQREKGTPEANLKGNWSAVQGATFGSRSYRIAGCPLPRLDFDLLARARLVFIETIEEFPTGLSEAKRVPEPHPAGQEFALALIRANFGSLSLLASL
jgi:hypothetical protein